MLELPNKKYDIILADPPWRYNFSKVKKDSIEYHYPTMELDEIKSIEINKITKENCALFMWATFPKLREAFEVIDAWGFEYKTVAFVWVKLNENGSPFFGIGYYTKSNAEICLLATKGNPIVKSNKISQVILSKRREHSRKPDESYVRIEELFGDVDRIELFARKMRCGWDAVGNQKEDEKQGILKC